jgi:FKBP-type peptidyl-prolyl cis-trans isomerase (trigger factor)
MTHKKHTHAYTAEIKNLLETGEVEITAEIDAEELTEAVSNTITSLKKNISIPGFRKGQAPEKMIRERVGISAILYDAAEEVLGHMLPHIFEDKNIDAVGRPKITITKLAEGNPLGFKAIVAITPVVKLDYKKIASKKNSEKTEDAVVTDKEVDETINKVLKERAGKDKEPEALTDEVAKELGEFKDVADLKKQVKENLSKEKELRIAEKKRIALFDALVEAAKIKIPKAMSDMELERMITSFKGDVKRMGLSFEDYLKSVKKTEDDMKKEWRVDADKKVTMELILEHIAKSEDLKNDPKKAEDETNELMAHYKDIDPMSARSYVEGIMMREQTIKFLEGLK